MPKDRKKKWKKEYLRKTGPETKLYSRNLIKRRNTCAVFLVRYSGPFINWIREEPQQMNQRIRKLITMHKALHPRTITRRNPKQNSSCTATNFPSQKPSELDEQNMWDIAGEVKEGNHKRRSSIYLFTQTSRCWTTSKNSSTRALYGHRM